MLSIRTLINKTEYKKITESNIDLTGQTFEAKNISIIGVALISDELVMRPDLIARVYYADSNKLDYILKFNGISNPFSIDSGQILFIGNEKELDGCFKPGPTIDGGAKEEDIRTSFLDTSKLSKKDAKRLELLKEKSAAAGASASSNLTPNMAEPGSKEITVKDGVVLFGNDIVANKDNCKDPVSRASIKAKLLQNKMFKNS